MGPDRVTVPVMPDWFRHPVEYCVAGGDPLYGWIPACAGMTGGGAGMTIAELFEINSFSIPRFKYNMESCYRPITSGDTRP